MNLATSILLGALAIALTLYISMPRYAYAPIGSSTNPAVWKLDTRSGDVSICATGTGKDAAGKDNESSCGTKFKQY